MTVTHQTSGEETVAKQQKEPLPRGAGVSQGRRLSPSDSPSVGDRLSFLFSAGCSEGRGPHRNSGDGLEEVHDTLEPDANANAACASVTE